MLFEILDERMLVFFSLNFLSWKDTCANLIGQNDETNGCDIWYNTSFGLSVCCLDRNGSNFLYTSSTITSLKKCSYPSIFYTWTPILYFKMEKLHSLYLKSIKIVILSL